MFCIKCGNQLSDDARFCHNCGSKVGANNSGNKKNHDKPKYETLKKSFDTETMKRKDGLDLINGWLSTQKIIIDKSFFKTFMALENTGFLKAEQKLKITYADFTYHTSNNGKRYMIDTVAATQKMGFLSVKNSANEMIEEAQKISEQEHPGAKVERVFDRQVILQGSIPYQTRVILYSYSE